MFGLGTGELVLILFVALLLFGPQKLPEVARGLGQAIRRFKSEANNLTEEVKRAAQDDNQEQKPPVK